ncbi:hypothetical protein Q8F55_001608 [Vanrija albida]|uniref:Protein CPL1-like domain-containing protein n=1 Tax=Vanrija albida TaxID=181172 RepID=A0ABR3QGG3_9TREE
MKSLLLALAFIGLLNGTTAIFVECAAVGGLLTGLISGVLGTVVTLLSQLTTGDQCTVQCKNLGYNYAIWAKGLSLDLKTIDGQSLLGTCWCNADGLPPNTVIKGADASGTCTSTILNLIGVRVDYVQATAVTLGTCSSSTGYPAGDNTQFTVASADQCFNSAQCATKKYISLGATGVRQDGLLVDILVGRSGGSYTCACSNTAPSGATVNCGDEIGSIAHGLPPLAGWWEKSYAFTNFQQTVASGGTRRRRAEQMRLAAQAKTLCPGGRSACRVPGSNDYECIDTTSELESCGGCAYGDFVGNGTLATGTDCTAIPGVVRGGVSCFRGDCVVTRCEKGLTLVDGGCI